MGSKPVFLKSYSDIDAARAFSKVYRFCQSHPATLTLTNTSRMRDQPLLNVSGDTHISGGQFNIVNNYHTSSPPKQTRVGFDRLHDQIAVTALHNALNSFESGKCHTNTREAVLNELFKFIQEDPLTRKHWILWLSGPAGSGKTTIARTIAYLCDEKGLNLASFFFCRMDLTRNGIKPLVATLAYQIACRFPIVKDEMVAEIERQPHLFHLSVKEQFDCLITIPLLTGGRKQGPGWTTSHPIVCVIDALDECEETRSRETQSHVVQTLHKLTRGAYPPLIFMLASRPEANLRMSFNRIQDSVLRVYLDSSYNPSVDIRRFVVDSFDELRTVHPFASLLPQDWPGCAEIDAIVAKSSGQFLYAATVVRYVSSPWCHPATSLENISHSLSNDTSPMPFTDLDNLFAFILGKAKHLLIVLNILLCHILSRGMSGDGFSVLLEFYGLKIDTIFVYFIEIISLAEIDVESHKLILYNESVVDFLVDSGRSGIFYLDLARASYDMVMKALRNRSCDNIPSTINLVIALLPKITQGTTDLKLELVQLSQETVKIHPRPFLSQPEIDKLFEGFWSLSQLVNGAFTKSYFELVTIWGSKWELDITPPSPILEFSMDEDFFPTEWALDTYQQESPPQHFVPFGSVPAREESRHRLPRTSDLYAMRQSAMSPVGSVPSTSPRFELEPQPGSPAWFRREFGHQLQDFEDLVHIKHHLASILISGATGMLFSSIANILGYDSASRTHILSAYRSLFEYNKEQTLSSHFGKRLLRYMSSSDSSGIYHLNVENFAIQISIQLLTSSNSYQGNLFGDLGALLVMMSHPTASLTIQLSTFATLALTSQLQVHVLDFATFLDGLAHMYYNNTNTGIALLTPESHLDVAANRASYLSMLRHLVQFWASRHQQLDPQLLGIPEFRGLWEQFVHTSLASGVAHM